jgi:RNA polymerase sigma-70 factor, ECF subfamily
MTIDTEPQALVAAAQAGDERAFRELVQPYSRALEVHCYRMLGSLQDAEDVMQETLLRAWRSLERFERRASVQTWLYRIATNACIDELERRPRRPQPVQPYPDSRLAEIASPVADPAARYALREGMELAFLTAIQALPGRQRAVLILRDVLGWTAREVADLLDSTVAATNSSLQRARATIDESVTPHAVAPRATHERALLARYMEVWEAADIDGFVALLAEDAELRMPPRRAISGAAALARFWFDPRGAQPCAASRSRLVPTHANGRPAFAIYKRRPDGGEEAFAVMLIDTDGSTIQGFDAWLEPDLVRRFA